MALSGAWGGLGRYVCPSQKHHWFMKIILLALLLALAGLVPVLAQTTTTTATADYLRDNHRPFDPAESGSYALFDSAFYAADVFMLGENHGYAAPQTIDLALLKHLNQRVGLRYYLAEMDVAQADLVNLYLTTGQKNSLDSLFRGFQAQTLAGTSQWGNRQFYDKIVGIRTYNLTRPDSLRIRFLGVDWFQHEGSVAIDWLRQTVQQRLSATATAANPVLDSLRLLMQQPTTTLGKLRPLAARVRADYQAHPANYAALLGDRLLTFRQIFEMLPYAGQGITRDEVAARLIQFLTTELHLEHEKLYGLWGYTHVLQAGVNKSVTLSGLLAKAGRRVVTMPIMFKDSRMLVHSDHVPFMFRKKGETFVEMDYLNADGRIFGVDGFRELLPVTTDNQTTLIKLDAPGSPYRNRLTLVNVGGLTGTKIAPNDADHTVTTDYFQYVFVVRNSPAVSLWPVALPD
jgi:Erythromycin esterase